jgi:FKBP-type peptidyl-prolyl cis-trans isomerase
MIQKSVPCALVAALLAAGALSAVSGVTRARQSESVPVPSAPTPQEVVTASGLRYKDLQVGQGAEAAKGKIVEILYTGWLEDRTKFDSSLDSAHPFTFRIGIDDVIQGWHEGVAGMKVGGRRRLVVPPELGYGKQGVARVVPPNATLVFDVELVGVR